MTAFARLREQIEAARADLLAQIAELTSRADALEQATVWLHHADGTADESMSIEPDSLPVPTPEPVVIVEPAADTATRARQILDELKGKRGKAPKAKAEPLVCPDCGKAVPTARGLAVHRGLKHPGPPAEPEPAGPVADALAILDQQA